MSAQRHESKERRRGFLLAGVVLFLVAEQSLGQDASTGGVYVDSKQTLRARPETRQDHLANVRRLARHRRSADGERDSELAFISLPRLFTEVERKLDAGDPLPERMRYLKGLVELRYLFLFEDERDLVIAGPAELWKTVEAERKGRPDRVVGRESERPVLRLDDLVAMLRAVGPGGEARAFGCSIEVPNDAKDRMANLHGGQAPADEWP